MLSCKWFKELIRYQLKEFVPCEVQTKDWRRNLTLERLKKRRNRKLNGNTNKKSSFFLNSFLAFFATILTPKDSLEVELNSRINLFFKRAILEIGHFLAWNFDFLVVGTFFWLLIFIFYSFVVGVFGLTLMCKNSTKG